VSLYTFVIADVKGYITTVALAASKLLLSDTVNKLCTRHSLEISAIRCW